MDLCLVKVDDIFSSLLEYVCKQQCILSTLLLEYRLPLECSPHDELRASITHASALVDQTQGAIAYLHTPALLD